MTTDTDTSIHHDQDHDNDRDRDQNKDTTSTNTTTNTTNTNNNNNTREIERNLYFSALSCWVKQATATIMLQHCFLANNTIPSPYPYTYTPLSTPTPTPTPAPVDHTRQQAGNRREIEYFIPPFWKRVLAEFLDFFILIVLKGVFVLIIEDHFAIIDYQYLDSVIKNLQEDYQFAVTVTWELIFVDLLMRMFTCIFEAVFLATDHAGRPGGATPGKAILGLRVLSATSVVRVENRPRETVLVHPGTNLSFRASLGRSITKNSIIPFLLPVFTPYFFTHNRTFYDYYWNVIVVQDVNRNRR